MYRDIWWYSIGVCISLRLLCVLYVHTETKIPGQRPIFCRKEAQKPLLGITSWQQACLYFWQTQGLACDWVRIPLVRLWYVYIIIYICIPSVWQQDQVMPLFQNPWHHIEWATWRQFNDNSIMQRQFITLASAPDSATPIWPHVNSRSISQIQASWELDRSLNLKGNSNTECYKESTSGG